MSMERFVKRHTRLILTIMVVMFSIPLVLSFGPWSPVQGAEDGVKRTTNRGEEILESDYRSARIWARPLHAFSTAHRTEDAVAFGRTEGISLSKISEALQYYNLSADERFDFQQRIRMMFYAQELAGGRSREALVALLRKFDDPPEEHYEETAWSMAVGLRRAAALGIDATDADVETWIRSDDRWWSRDEGGFKQDQFELMIKPYGMSPPDFRAFVRAMVTFEKYLALMTDHAATPLKDVKIGEGGRHGRVWYALFDPEQSTAPVAVSDADVRKYYDENQRQFRSKPRIAFDYLFLPFDAYEARVPAPPEEELQAYYREHAARFTEMPPHEHVDEDHQEPEPRQKTYEEVRGEILKLLTRPKAVRLAQKDMGDVWLKLIDQLNAGDPAVSRAVKGLAIDLNATATSLRARNVPMEYGLTAMLADSLDDEKTVDEKIGRGVDPDASWSAYLFNPALEIGSIDEAVIETEKGLAIVRLTQKAETQPLPLDEAQERKIRRVLENEKRAERVTETVEAFGERLEKGSFAAALDWVNAQGLRPDVGESGYFHENEPPAVDFALRRDLTQAAGELMRAAATPGAPRRSVRTIEIDRNPRILCVYLRDVVELPPGDVDQRVEELRANEREGKRAEARLDLRNELVQSFVDQPAAP